MSRAFYVGRFQPVHNGHMEVIKAILDEWEEVVIGIGSAYQSHTLKNPFTGGERAEMIIASMKEEDLKNYFIVPVPDIDRYELWPRHISSISPKFSAVYTNNPILKSLFGEQGYDVKTTAMFSREDLSGREIRRRILDGESWHDLLPDTVVKIMEELNGVERLRLAASNDYQSGEEA